MEITQHSIASYAHDLIDYKNEFFYTKSLYFITIRRSKDNIQRTYFVEFYQRLLD